MLRKRLTICRSVACTHLRRCFRIAGGAECMPGRALSELSPA